VDSCSRLFDDVFREWEGLPKVFLGGCMHIFDCLNFIYFPNTATKGSEHLETERFGI
jgi:hypothetical protein